jgi:hypothetical protein
MKLEFAKPVEPHAWKHEGSFNPNATMPQDPYSTANEMVEDRWKCTGCGFITYTIRAEYSPPRIPTAPCPIDEIMES